MEDDTPAILGSVGKQIEIKLKLASGTGYVWKPRLWDASLFEYVREESTTTSDVDLMGGETVITFYFMPLKAGRSVIRFGLFRPWEATQQPASTAEFTVDITGRDIENVPARLGA